MFHRAVFPTPETIRADTGLAGRPLIVEQSSARPRHLSVFAAQLVAPFRPWSTRQMSRSARPASYGLAGTVARRAKVSASAYANTGGPAPQTGTFLAKNIRQPQSQYQHGCGNVGTLFIKTDPPRQGPVHSGVRCTPFGYPTASWTSKGQRDQVRQ